jgi:hypothetical protein
MRVSLSLSLFVLLGFSGPSADARPLPEPQPGDPDKIPVLIHALDEVSAEELRRRGAPPMALSYAKRLGEIRIDWRALGVQPEDADDFRFVGGQRLIVEPFAGLRLEATGISVREGAEGAQTWMGRIERPGSGQVTITRHGDAVFGNVDYGLDRYVFQSGRDGRVFVREADQRGLGRCAFDARAEGLPRFDQGLFDRVGAASAAVPATANGTSTGIAAIQGDSATEAARKPHSSQVAAAKSNGHATVDILVLYTPDVAAGAGGNPQAMIQNFVDHANMSFMDGQIQGSLNLVGTSLIFGVNQALGPFATWEQRANELKAGSGAFSGVATIRDAMGADLVALLVVAGPEWIGGQWVWPAVCGVANGGSRLAGLTDPAVGSVEAFSITDTWCSAADLTFTHEIGHNLGGLHDNPLLDHAPLANLIVGEQSIIAATRGSVGYTQPAGTVRFRTIMGSNGLPDDPCARQGDENGCPRINRWSTPNQSMNFYGVATEPLGGDTGYCLFHGVQPAPCPAGTTPQVSDMVASHQFAMPHVASYRAVQQAPPLPPGGGWIPVNCKPVVDLFWSPDPASAPALTYELEASSLPGFPWWLTNLVYMGPGTSHLHEVNGTTYFRVRACNQAGCSAWGNFEWMPVVYPWC